MLVDTHCHIQDESYPHDVDETIVRAYDSGVEKMISVGTDIESSRRSAELALRQASVFSSLGIHPHEAGSNDVSDLVPIVEQLTAQAAATNKLVAIGEIGLDYFYMHTPKDVQIQSFRKQLDLALKYDLPVIFHVRDAFDDFWPIFDSYGGKIRGVLHSFTDSRKNMEKAIERGLYIGVNGISTFTKDTTQQQTFASIPLEKLLLETDAPFLTPIPLRGKVNEPAFVRHVAEFHAANRAVPLSTITTVTTANALALFAL